MCKGCMPGSVGIGSVVLVVGSDLTAVGSLKVLADSSAIWGNEVAVSAMDKRICSLVPQLSRLAELNSVGEATKADGTDRAWGGVCALRKNLTRSRW